MDILHVIVLTGGSFLFLALTFRPIEKVFPAKKGQHFFRSGWVTDLLFFLGQYLFWGGLMTAFLFKLDSWLGYSFPESVRLAIGAQPVWMQAIEVIVLSDLLVYWAHRLQHKIDWLWRFHSIHHSAKHLDWLAAHREHPLDTLYTVGLINLPAILMGFQIEAIAAFIAFRGIWAIYIHSNVRLPIGPIRMLIGAPELHHWHHAKDRDAGNYANLSPLMDLLFGTYSHPQEEPEEFGIEEQIAESYWGQLWHPFRNRKN